MIIESVKRFPLETGDNLRKLHFIHLATMVNLCFVEKKHCTGIVNKLLLLTSYLSLLFWYSIVLLCFKLFFLPFPIIYYSRKLHRKWKRGQKLKMWDNFAYSRSLLDELIASLKSFLSPLCLFNVTLYHLNYFLLFFLYIILFPSLV